MTFGSWRGDEDACSLRVGERPRSTRLDRLRPLSKSAFAGSTMPDDQRSMWPRKTCGTLSSTGGCTTTLGFNRR